jgi:hypothetical protein
MSDVSMTVEVILQNPELGEQFVVTSVTASSLEDTNRKLAVAFRKLAEEFEDAV